MFLFTHTWVEVDFRLRMLVLIGHEVVKHDVMFDIMTINT